MCRVIPDDQEGEHVKCRKEPEGLAQATGADPWLRNMLADIAKADTGASRTSIDADIAATIGAGPVQTTATVRSATASSSRTWPVVNVVIGIGGTQHTVAASIEDRSHMEYPVLLGRDILSEYSVDIEKRADEPSMDEE